MNGEFVPNSKATSIIDSGDDELLTSFTAPAAPAQPAAPAAPVAPEKDDSFTDIMSIFNRK